MSSTFSFSAADCRPISQLRLTQRGRLVVVITLLALALAAFTLVGSPAASTDTPHHSTGATVVVQPGQTLWDIAAEKAPTSDPRDFVAAIVALNNLTNPGAIRAGQPLYVPVQ
jgi:LysM repeat protein